VKRRIIQRVGKGRVELEERVSGVKRGRLRFAVNDLLALVSKFRNGGLISTKNQKEKRRSRKDFKEG